MMNVLGVFLTEKEGFYKLDVDDGFSGQNHPFFIV